MEDAIGYLKILEDIVHVLLIFVGFLISLDWLLGKASIPYKLYILLRGEITGLFFFFFFFLRVGVKVYIMMRKPGTVFLFYFSCDI